MLLQLMSLVICRRRRKDAVASFVDSLMMRRTDQAQRAFSPLCLQSLLDRPPGQQWNLLQSLNEPRHRIMKLQPPMRYTQATRLRLQTEKPTDISIRLSQDTAQRTFMQDPDLWRLQHNSIRRGTKSHCPSDQVSASSNPPEMRSLVLLPSSMSATK